MRLLTLLAATLWAGTPALADDLEGHASTDLHRPRPAAPPPPDAVRLVVAQLVEAARAERVDTEQVRDLWQPSALPLPPDRQWLMRVVEALGPDGALGGRLRTTEGIVALSDGPDYTRALLGGEPLLSVVVRTSPEGLPVVDRIETTSCALCDEPARFVRDLLAEVRRSRSARGRLLPGVELEVASWLAANPRVVPHHWLAALQARNHRGGHLDWLLTSARVSDVADNVVKVVLADGREDTWTITYSGGQWQVIYDALPDASPLRMSLDEAEHWRTLASQAEAALLGWSPAWATTRDGAGLLVGDRAIGAAFDPVDGTVIVGVLDIDRTLAGVLRVDPDRRRVVERVAIPSPGDGAPIPWQTWFQRWHFALSADGRRAALSAPGRVWQIDLASAEVSQAWRGNDVVTLAWAHDAGDDRLLVGTASGLVSAPGLDASYQLDAAPLRLALAQGDLLAVTADGAVLALPRAGGAPRRVQACPGGAVDAARHPRGDEVLVLCAAGDDVLATRVPWPPDTPEAVPGAAIDRGGASFSPGGRYFTTGAPGDGDPLLLWDAHAERPVATLGVSPVRRVAWSPDGRQVLTVEIDGRVWLWDVATLRRERGL